jgi:hypothetical protein
MGTYRWIRHDGQRLDQVGVRPDGTLHNPHHYPEPLVRAAVTAADARWCARRQAAAAKAVATRARRRALALDRLAARVGALAFEVRAENTRNNRRQRRTVGTRVLTRSPCSPRSR